MKALIIGLIAIDHIYIKEEKLWKYYGSFGGGSASNIHYTLKFFGIDSFLIGAIGNKNPNDKSIALKTYDEKEILLYEGNNSETRSYFHLIEKKNEIFNHSYSSTCPICRKKQNSSIQLRLEKKISEIFKKIKNSDLIYFDRISKSILKIAEFAFKQKKFVIFDLGSFSTRYIKEDLLRNAIKFASHIQIPSEKVKVIYKIFNVNSFSEINPNLISYVITNKKENLCFHHNVGIHTIPQINNKKILESGGAGDSYMSMFIYDLLKRIQGFEKYSALPKKKFIEIMEHCKMNAYRSCLYFGARTYIYDMRNALKKQKISLDKYLNKEIDDNFDYFDRSIRIIEKYGQKIPILCEEGKSKEKVKLIGETIYEKNLNYIPQAVETDLKFFHEEKFIPKDGIIIIGSGGSYSVAKAIEYSIFSEKNVKSKIYAMTPFDYILRCDQDFSVILISYGATNNDVKCCLDKAINNNAKQIFLVTRNGESSLSKRVLNLSNGRLSQLKHENIERGYVGVYSIISSIIVTAKLLIPKSQFKEYNPFFKIQEIKKRMKFNRNKISQQLLTLSLSPKEKYHFLGLASGLSYPAIIDLESKFVECNLGSIEICELKNYTHGRYLSLYNSPNNKILLIIKSPKTKSLVEYLQKKLEKVAPMIIIETAYDDFRGLVDCFEQILLFINYFSKEIGIDPSKPGFPKDAKGLYDWNGLNK